MALIRHLHRVPRQQGRVQGQGLNHFPGALFRIEYCRYDNLFALAA